MRVTLLTFRIIFHHVYKSSFTLRFTPLRHSLSQRKFLFSLKKCKTQKRVADRLLQALPNREFLRPRDIIFYVTFSINTLLNKFLTINALRLISEEK